MKKLLFILFLFAFVSSQGQVIRTNSFYVAPAVAAGGYCAEYQAVYDAYSNAPGTDTADVLNTFVVNAKAHGYWAKGDLIYWLAAKNATDALLMWLNPTGDDNCTATGSPAFAQWQGYTGGAGKDLNTNFIPSSEATYFAQNSATVAVYSRSSVAGANAIILGTDDGLGKRISIYPRFTDNYFYLRLNATDAGVDGVSLSNSQGFFAGTRSGATTTEGYRNGSHVFDGTGTSTGISADEVYILCMKPGVAPSACQIAFVYVGGLLSDQEIADMATDVEVVLDYLGTGIIP